MDDGTRDKIERACERLSRLYSQHVDFGDYDAFVDLFAEDGVLNTGAELNGREAIRKAMTNRPDALRSRHVVTNHVVEVIDEDHAEGITYLSLYRLITEDAKDPLKVLPLEGPAAIGHYTDKYVRTPDGWRFASRVLSFAFRDRRAFPGAAKS